MSVETGIWGVVALGILLILRLPVALALIIVSFSGIWAMIGLKPALGILENTPYSFVASWTMSAVPMFLLMGFVAFHTGMTGGLFAAAKVLLARLPGGLAISSIFACSAFASVSGSSVVPAMMAPPAFGSPSGAVGPSTGTDVPAACMACSSARSRPWDGAP